MSRLRHLAAIAARELAGQRLAFGAALLVGLLALVFPLLLWAPRAPAAEVRGAFALAVLLPGLLLYALGLGATLLASDLAERRLSFYLVRPVSIAVLWVGKLLGGTLALTVAALLVQAPSWLTGARWVEAMWPLDSLRAAAAIAFLLVLGIPASLAAVHVATVAVRSRSAWLLADLLALAVLLVLVVPGVRQLLHHGAHAALGVGAAGAGLVAAVVVIVGGGWALARGRTEPARVHRAAVLFLWPALLAVALVFAAFARWTVTPPAPVFAELQVAELTPRGDRVVVAGPLAVRRYHAAFLVDPASGQAVRLGAMWPVLGSLAFSADGTTLAWMRLGEPGDERRPVFALEIGDDVPRRTGIALAAGSRLALSPDGSLLATVGASGWTVHRLADGATLLAVRRPQGAVQDLRFVAPRQVVLWMRDAVEGPDARQEQRDRIWLLDLDRRSVRRTLDLPVAGAGPGSFTAEGLVEERRAAETRLHDPATGAVAADLPLAEVPRKRLHRLADGRWLAAAGVTRELLLLSSTGAVERRIDLERGIVGSIGPEIAPGKVVVSLFGPAPADLPRTATALDGLAVDPDATLGRHVQLVDVVTGERSLLAEGLTVVPQGATAVTGGPVLVLHGGLPRRGRLYWWDPAADRTRTVVTASAATFSLLAEGAAR